MTHREQSYSQRGQVQPSDRRYSLRATHPHRLQSKQGPKVAPLQMPVDSERFSPIQYSTLNCEFWEKELQKFDIC